jgi:hypothetical protein
MTGPDAESAMSATTAAASALSRAGDGLRRYDGEDD